ncbi:MAG: HSP90 family protein [Ancrocorticia sp.]
MTHRFQVDLSGMVDLLSRHLYSGPQVYLRELLQNGVDALAARNAIDPGAPARIRLRCGVSGDGLPTLEFRDTGSGLTADEAADLLATIGRSSKRDTLLGEGRAEFIGQFGIGLLAAFMVAEHIEVRSCSVRPGAVPISWVGHSDGTFDVTEEPEAEREIGTTVHLVARPDSAHWLEPETVVGLAQEYGSLLPVDVSVEVVLPDGTKEWRRLTEPELPWRTHANDPRALTAYCEKTFRFTPLGYIDLNLPAVGVSGVAFILPQAVSPGSGQHRVYVKRMLLGPRIDQLLPEWAFFARAVLNTDTLSPTASREQLHDDEMLLWVRNALADRIKQWVWENLRQPTALARRFISTHHLALRALALTDADLLDLVAEILPYETTDGTHTLAELNADGILYTSTTEAFRSVAAVARAQGVVVVNAGYVYDAQLLETLSRRPGMTVRELASDDLVQILREPSWERELELAAGRSAARQLMEPHDCEVIVRGFAPDNVPAMLLRESEGERRRELDQEREAAPERWGGLLDAFAAAPERRSRTLVLNDDSPLVSRLLTAPDSEVFGAGLTAVYLSAVMSAGEGLRARESAALTEALDTLLDHSLSPNRETP